MVTAQELQELDPRQKLVVRDGYALYWPDGQIRGTAGYAVYASDPLIREQHHKLYLTDKTAKVDPPSEWPLIKYRKRAAELGGDQWLTDAERLAKADAEARERREKRAQQEKTEAAESETQEPDEELSPDPSKQAASR